METFIRPPFKYKHMAWSKYLSCEELRETAEFKGKLKECNHCGTKEDLIFHHISYDPEIFYILCRSCHIKFHRRFPDRGPESERKYKGTPKYTTITIKRKVKQELEDFAFEMKYPRTHSWGQVLIEMIKEVKDYRSIKKQYRLR